MVTVWQTLLLLSCYDCDSTRQHYDVTRFKYVLWCRTMHEWVMNIHYQAWIAQGRFINMIRTPSKQWSVCDNFGNVTTGNSFSWVEIFCIYPTMFRIWLEDVSSICWYISITDGHNWKSFMGPCSPIYLLRTLKIVNGTDKSFFVEFVTTERTSRWMLPCFHCGGLFFRQEIWLQPLSIILCKGNILTKKQQNHELSAQIILVGSYFATQPWSKILKYSFCSLNCEQIFLSVVVISQSKEILQALKESPGIGGYSGHIDTV